MSGSRKSLQKAAQTFNPRAENSWSKDDSKFGQRMLEKMGWKKGEGIGRDGQGVKENIKIRWKLDSKGLGFSIKEDGWVAVEHDFSKLLSNLNKECTSVKTTKLSLESTSSSSRSRVHYRKFIRGKDISKYSRKDLSGILGRNAEVSDENDSEDKDHEVDDHFADLMKLSCSSGDPVHADENCGEMLNNDPNSKNDSKNVKSNELQISKSRNSDSPLRNSRKRKSKTKDLEDHKVDDISAKHVKLSFGFGDHLHADENCEEMLTNDADLKNDSDNVKPDEPQVSKSKDSDSPFRNSRKRKSKTKDLEDHKMDGNAAERMKLSCSSGNHVRADENCEEMTNDVDLRNDSEDVEPDEPQVSKSRDLDSTFRNLRKRKSKTKELVGHKVDDNSAEQMKSSCSSGKHAHADENCEEMLTNDADLKNDSKNVVPDDSQVSKSRDSNSPLRNTRKRKPTTKNIGDKRPKVDDFDYFMHKVTEFNATTDPKAVIEEFEKNKEALLKRYRESYLRNYLESANENDSRIYCDLNGDELDCENDVDEGDCETNEIRKMKPSKHPRVRPLTKAERIVRKARLLKTIQNKTCSHSFAGSNLDDIVGYGNSAVPS